MIKTGLGIDVHAFGHVPPVRLLGVLVAAAVRHRAGEVAEDRVGGAHVGLAVQAAAGDQEQREDSDISYMPAVIFFAVLDFQLNYSFL